MDVGVNLWHLVEYSMTYVTQLATVYANLGEEGLLHALKQTECEIVFTSNDLLPTIVNLCDQFPLKTVIYKGKATSKVLSQLEEKSIKILTLEEFEKIGQESSDEIVPPKPSDLASVESVFILVIVLDCIYEWFYWSSKRSYANSSKFRLYYISCN